AELVQMDVADFEDLAHAADAEAIDDLILAVEQPRRVGALEVRHSLAAVRTEIVFGVDLLFTSQACDLVHVSGLATRRCRPGPHRNAPRLPASIGLCRHACC